MVTGDSQEEVIIFRDTQTDRHSIIIYISSATQRTAIGGSLGSRERIGADKRRHLFAGEEIYQNPENGVLINKKRWLIKDFENIFRRKACL